MISENSPRSPHEKVGDLVYFGRMVDKIRLDARGALPEDLKQNLGAGFDGLCCEFLGVSYAELREQVLQGGNDEEILQWCQTNGRKVDATLRFLWNQCLPKRGWKDDLSQKLAQRLEENGFGDRSDIKTMFDFIDLDEGRDPAKRSTS